MSGLDVDKPGLWGPGESADGVGQHEVGVLRLGRGDGTGEGDASVLHGWQWTRNEDHVGALSLLGGSP
jgi:hypothetical protein